MEKRDLNATRKALINAAEELLKGCRSPEEVTSRKIAAQAGVNAAMINYCFGSREQLMYEVFRGLLTKARELRPELDAAMSDDLSPAQKLIEIHFTLMELMLDNPKISKAVTKFILFDRDLKTGLDSLPLVMEHFAGKKSEDECRLITFELTSLHELAVLRKDDIKACCGTDLSDKAQLRKFVEENVRRFLYQV